MPAGLDKETLDSVLASLSDFAAQHFPTRSCSSSMRATNAAHPSRCAAPSSASSSCSCPSIRRHRRRRLRRLPAVRGARARRRRRRHGVARDLPWQRPDRRRRDARAERQWLNRIADEGLLMAYAATEPSAGSDLAALRTTATPRRGGRPDRRLQAQRPQAMDQQRRRGRRLHRARATHRRAELVHRREGHAGPQPRQPGGQARHPAHQHGGALARRCLRRGRPPGRRGRGPGPAAGAGRVRLHAPDGRRVRPRRRLGGARPRHPLLRRAHPGRRAAVREAGLHPQADRPPRRAPGGGSRLHRGDGGSHRRARRAGGRVQHRGRHRQVHGHARPATPPPTPPSRRSAATATPTNTWSRRSSATCASPPSTRARRRSWR